MSEEPPEAHPSRPLSQLQLKRMKFLASLTATIVSRRLRLRATEGCGDNKEDRSGALNG
jgi:hypothetical protein